jgi:hypothetical protein
MWAGWECSGVSAARRLSSGSDKSAPNQHLGPSVSCGSAGSVVVCGSRCTTVIAG